MILTHGKNRLDEFLKHLNNLHQKKKQIGQNHQLSFLNVMDKKRADGSLVSTIYRKVTHTDRFFNARLHQDPAQLQ